MGTGPLGLDMQRKIKRLLRRRPRPLEDSAAIEWLSRRPMAQLLRQQLGQGELAILHRNRGNEAQANAHIYEQGLITEAIHRRASRTGYATKRRRR